MRKFTFTLLMIFIASLTFAQISFENPVNVTQTGDISRGYSSSIGDLDGDGDNDVVVCGMDSNNVLWYANDGSGTFSSASTLITNFSGATFSTVADIDGDGDNDVIATSWYSDGVYFFKNDGSGNFTEQQLSDNITGGWHIFTADIDGDGVLDVIVSARNESGVYWFKTTVDEGTGAVTFSNRNTVVNTGLDWVGGMHVGDIDGDGDVDVAVASLGYGSAFTNLTWFANDGSGNFTQKQTDMYVPAVEEDQIERVWIADFDNDGDNDIVFGLFSNGNGYVLAWCKNSNGFGLFDAAENIHSGAPGEGFTDMLLTDIDADNDLDVVFSYSAGYDDKIAYIQNIDNTVYFSFYEIATISGTEPPWVQGLNVADLDGDNDIDITYTEYRNDYAAWIETNLPPVIFEQAVDIETCAGQDTLFGIKANLADSYQWQVDDGSGFTAITDGGVYSGATTDTLHIAGLTSDMDSYTYKCVVTNTNGTSESDVKTLTVSQPFSITTQPQDASAQVGSNVSFSVVTDITTNLTYQWRFNGTNLSDGGTISGATTSTLTITGVTVHDGGDYDCVITGICNEETSDVATLTTTTPSSINDIENSISIYPNPTTGIFTIDLRGSARPRSIEITDITGKKIKKISIINNKSSIINLKNQPEGVYLIKIQTENGIINRKIVKK